ncbi:hypothetical protein AB834_07610 [PVC group bacterium (ex Bugula neritina AB1)]|nr:hypothetical protein AB834_07610 [PVC group bacterium (ex Bugula neritina AB1)]
MNFLKIQHHLGILFVLLWALSLESIHSSEKIQKHGLVCREKDTDKHKIHEPHAVYSKTNDSKDHHDEEVEAHEDHDHTKSPHKRDKVNIFSKKHTDNDHNESAEKHSHSLDIKEHQDHDDSHDSHDHTSSDHDHNSSHKDAHDHSHVDKVTLTSEDLKDFGIHLSTAKSGEISKYIELTGEVSLNANKEAHIIPRFEGLVIDVLKSEGDQVNKGETLATLEGNNSLTAYDLKSLLDGIVLKRHITIGEFRDTSAVAFTIGSIDTLWIKFRVYPKTLPLISKKSYIKIKSASKKETLSLPVFYISSIIDEKTRTAEARVSLPNPDHLFLPGMFVKGQLLVEKVPVDIKIPKESLQFIDGKWQVFVSRDRAFFPTSVKLGHENETFVEILEGLSHGDTYVTKGSFTLKAELAKAAFDDGHVH